MLNRLVWVVLLLPSLALAHGGVLQFHAVTGSFVVTLFSAEAPLRIGPQDLTILVQRRDNSQTVEDADVILRLEQAGQPPINIRAKLNAPLYLATVEIPHPGIWTATIGVNAAAATGNLTVQPAAEPLQAYWPYFAIVPAGVLIYTLNRWLKRRRERYHPR